MSAMLTKYGYAFSQRMPMIRLGVWLVAIWTVGMMAPETRAGESRPHTMLVLHSYHQGLSWTDNIHRGMISVFERGPFKTEIHTEYMDSKRIFDAAYLSRLHGLYTYKYQHRRFDLILCSDNNALEFLLKYRDELFPDTPVVFCGINNFRKSMLEGHDLYTGTTEAVDIRETLDTALRLHPDLRHIVVYGDNSPTYLINKRSLADIRHYYDPGLTFRFHDSLDIQGIEKNAQRLPEASLILLMSTIRDREGQLIPFERSAELISGFCDIPVYGFWNFYLGHGIVGGKLVNGFFQGKTAAQLALRILNGEAVADIPPAMQSPNRYMFDYRQLRRFGIPLSALPEDSLVINRPDSFYSRHKALILGTGAGIAGLILIIFILSMNIIHRKRAQEALRKTERKYRVLVENSLQGVLIFQGIPPVMTFANAFVEEIFGYTPDELLAFSPGQVWDIIHPDDRATVSGRLRDHMAGMNPPQRYPFRILRKDGSVRWVEVLASRIEGGEPPTAQAIYIDITERMKAHRALRESESKFRNLFDLSPQGIALTETETDRIMDVNAEFCKLSGFSREELVGRKTANLPFCLSAERQRLIRRIQAAGKVRGLEMNCRAKDGSSVDTLVSANLVELADQSCLLSIFIDVTEQKRAQREKEALQKKLARSRRMEAIGMLAGGVAHDLNNILSGIVSYPELLLMKPDLGKADRKALTVIRDAGARAAEVISDMLTVTRGAASSREAVSLNRLAEEYLRSPEFKALEMRHPDVRYHYRPDAELLTVSGSPIHLRKTLMNLVINASEAIDESGSVTISTRNRYMDRPLKGYDHVRIGEYVLLEVTDDGSGISPEDLERIFEPFYTKKVMGRGGTGLGLAVVWNTVQDHEGYIDVESGPAGSRFTLYFPVCRSAAIENRNKITADTLRGRGEQILVIDDEASQREIACDMLTALGYIATAVSGGEAAIEYLSAHRADLIILDMIMMPGLNGRETYEEIIKIHPRQKAIIASGFSETEEVKAAQRLGAGRYIRKPYTLEKIARAIRAELETP